LAPIPNIIFFFVESVYTTAFLNYCSILILNRACTWRHFLPFF